MSSRLERAEADGLLKGLFGLLKAQRLYPPGHAAIQKAGETVDRTLRAALSGRGPLLLARADGYLVVGDIAFLGDTPQAIEISRLLEARELEGVILTPGVSAAEAAKFCGWLSAEGAGEWVSPHISTTSVSREGTLWKRAERLRRTALEAVEEAYREVEEGRIPDPARARNCVAGLSELLQENPLILSALTLIKDYDRYTFHHSVNVCVLALGLGRQLRVGDDALECLGVGGLFHDIGKTRTPLGVIQKPGRLSGDEWSLMLNHPVHGREIVSRMASLPGSTADVVYQHHMRADGRGYPARPSGQALNPLTPLVAVADVYDAMTTHRPYSAPLPLPTAIETMAKMKGSHFDPTVLDAFLRMMGPVPVGSLMRLSSGEVAVVAKLGEGGAACEARVVTGADGRAIAREDQPLRAIGPADLVGAVGALSRKVEPYDVLKPRE